MNFVFGDSNNEEMQLCGSSNVYPHVNKLFVAQSATLQLGPFFLATAILVLSLVAGTVVPS